MYRSLLLVLYAFTLLLSRGSMRAVSAKFQLHRGCMGVDKYACLVI
jgi:hypothetical protein